MIPAKRLFYAVGLGTAISIAYAILPILGLLFDLPDTDSYQETTLAVWLIYNGGLSLIALADLIIGYRICHVTITRHLPGNLSIGNWITVRLTIEHKEFKPSALQIFDHYPKQAITSMLPLHVEIVPGKTSRISYRFQPLVRGDLTFGHVQYRLPSPFRLWSVNRYSGEPVQIKVYPNFKEIKKYILLGLDDRTSQLGIKLQQRRGQGMEFHRLRKYQRGDSIRQINWKATSKKHELISKEYQDERDQQIFFLLDCGRRMRSKDSTLTHFDHALNSMLLLSYVALRQGDAVGLMSFSGKENVWINPLKGSSRINTILNSVYSLHACSKNSDYIAAAEQFFKRQKKRSLVILISNSRDDNIEELAIALSLLKKRHLVLFANLREQVLDTTLKTPVTSFEEALSFSATSEFLHKRAKAMKGLTHRNVISLDVTAKQLPVAIINAYHKLKRRGQL
ncbi:DUF58 domain-containing protein [bacterium]|nr:DUF58 domain-containing protein [bacterium]